MSEPFDPYREWLGIEGGRPAANYYRMFGLAPFESDLRTILSAADAAIGRVEKIATALHDSERKALLAEMRAAKLCLLIPDSRREYDATLAQPSAPATDPPADAALTSVMDAPDVRPSPLPTAIPLTRPRAAAQAADEVSASLWEGEPEAPRKPARPAAPARSHSLAGVLSVALAAGVLAIGGFVFWQFFTADEVPLATGADVSTSAERSPDTAAPDIAAAPRQASVPSAIDRTPSPSVGGAEPAVSPPVSDAPAEVPMPRPDPTAVYAPRAAVAAAGEPAAAPPSIACAHALNHVRLALVARRPEVARHWLAMAESSATPADAATVRQLSAGCTQLERFMEAMRIGLTKFEPAEALPVDEGFVAIVETRPEDEWLALRVEGKREEYTLATLPAPLAVIVATAGVDDQSPKGKLLHGAFQALDRHGDRQRARELWDAAAAARADVADLLPLLEPKALAIERLPVPAGSQLDLARDRVAQEFTRQIKGAVTLDQRGYLVDKLLAAAGEADDAAVHYALVSEAGAQAALAADVTRVLAATDELGAWFDVDPLTCKACAVAKVAEKVRGPKRSGEVAQAALGLLDEAVAEHRQQEAELLSAAAVAAANRSGNAELRKRASQRQRELTGAAPSK